MSSVDLNNGFSRNDASVLAERLQVDQAQARARARDPHAELKTRIHRACIAKLGAAFLNLEGSDELERRVQEVVSEELKGEEVPLSPSERALLERQIGDDILGYGPLEPFLRDPSVTEIMVNGYDQLYIERGGVIQETDASFLDDAHVLRIIDRIVSQVGRRVDESSPMVDARLPDGSRVNAIISPLALRGPSLTIRKFAQDALTLESLVELGTMTPQTADFLAQCVRGKLNLLISGGTGTGKTTLLNAVSQFVPAGERIVTVEDAAELRLQQRHVVPLESRPPNVEGEGEVRIRDLVRNALRMRPDRIIVGECRGAEALDMIQAMNTGHAGSMTTVHANSSTEVIERLEVLMLMAADLPMVSLHRQIASAIDLIVQITRFPDGRRRVTQISELTGVHPETKEVIVTDIFNYRNGVSLQPTGYLPSFIDSLIEKRLLESRFLYGDMAATGSAKLGNAPAAKPAASIGHHATAAPVAPAPAKSFNIPPPPPPRAQSSELVENGAAKSTPAAASAGDEWYCLIAGNELGPMNRRDVRRMVRDGAIKPDDLVRCGPSGAWLPSKKAGLSSKG